jgi:maltose alpha-D-glucosyltransferase/alpha-amylase
LVDLLDVVSPAERDPWYDRATIYALDVELFNDADGDGVGDFQGLIDRLDYLNRLGVSALWLLPFYGTPNRDNGYDVSDYYAVDDRLGTLGDFVDFVHEAEDRGIHVIVDLVVNHTSDQHPWFQQAREDPDSKYRDYYVWRDEIPEEHEDRGSVFPGEVEPERVWTYDDVADAYYYHRFYPFQPDLNVRNPAVRDEIRQIMEFYLELGVSGFRVDAATLMIEQKDPDGPELDDPHDILREMKEVVLRHRGDGILLAEADDDPEHLDDYFGENRNEMDLLLNFVLHAHLLHGLATESAGPIHEGLDRLPDVPGRGKWANFLGNFDELNIGRLAREAQHEVYEHFAPEPDMRIYGRGIRRRLASILGGDRKRIELALSVLFSLPGVPLLIYGTEIGMGEDLSQPGRTSVRTPMQWSAEKNGGFSDASVEDLVRPVIEEGEFGTENVSVAAQRADPNSLLNWTERLIATRNESPEIVHGRFQVIDTGVDSVLAFRYDWNGDSVLCVHNLADDPVSAALDLNLEGAYVYPVIGDADLEPDDGTYRMSLDAYGTGWFRAASVRRNGASRLSDES